MDKNQTPQRRKRKPLNLFRNKVSSEQRERVAPRQKKPHRQETLGWLKTIFKAVKRVFAWFGGYVGRPQQPVRPTVKPEKRYPPWMEKRIARNRRRRKLGNISRRRNNNARSL